MNDKLYSHRPYGKFQDGTRLKLCESDPDLRLGNV